MKMKVVYPFILNNKTYLPGNIVEDSLFAGGNESIKANFLKTGFLVSEHAKTPEVIVKEEGKKTPIDFSSPAKQIKVPQAVEIKTPQDLIKAVEGPKPEAPKAEEKPVEPKPAEVKPPTTTPIQPATKQKGRVSRS